MHMTHGVHADIALFILERRDYLEIMEEQLRSFEGFRLYQRRAVTFSP